MVAVAAAPYIEKLLDSTCGWMASYIDVDDGFLQCIPAEPRHVAQIAGPRTHAVVNRTTNVDP